MIEALAGMMTFLLIGAMYKSDLMDSVIEYVLAWICVWLLFEVLFTGIAIVWWWARL